MITYFCLENNSLTRFEVPHLQPLPEHTVWVDLLGPTAEEELFVEKALGLNVPTRQEMAEIEESARFYKVNDALYMTAVLVTGIGECRPISTEVTFVFTRERLVSIRYADPLPFRNFDSKNQREPWAHTRADLVFISLLESIVCRIADVLKIVEEELEHLSDQIFSDEKANPGPRNDKDSSRINLQAVVKRLGRNNALIVKLRESLLSLTMLLTYFQQGTAAWLPEDARGSLKILARDLSSLSTYQVQMSSEITFLLEGTLGLINIEQNSIIKVFSVAAVLFLPPTLVGTIYGMNFRIMPELSWAYGYPFTLALMIASAILPYYWFKHRRWL